MKLIVITWPDFILNEAELLQILFEEGLEFLHLRKPGADALQIRQLLEAISPKWYSRIILHDHYSLVEEFRLRGVHLNQRNKSLLGTRIPFSCSCHSFQEVIRFRPAVSGYLFVSPVYDSISKAGYQGAFTEPEIQQAIDSGIIASDVIALGGISPHHIDQLRSWHFGGAAVLGALWKPYLQTNDPIVLRNQFIAFKKQISL